MIAVTSPGFVLFAALLAGLWYACAAAPLAAAAGGKPTILRGALPGSTAGAGGQQLSGLVVRAAHREKARVPCGACGGTAAAGPAQVSAAALGWQGTLANALGIGYFTLQLVSYLCDVRRGRILPEEKYARLLCYASFFLSITQGPFNRYDA